MNWKPAFNAAMALCAGPALALNGDLDTGFGDAGIALTALTDAAGNGAYGPVIQTDGKSLICDTRTNNGTSGRDMVVARFTAAGVLDASFNFDGKVTVDFDGGAGSDACFAIALQADGRILLAGSTATDGNTDFAIARLTADGTLDTSFGAGTGKVRVPFDLVTDGSDQAAAVAVQADGKIVVAGTVATPSGGSDFGIVRLLADGTRDTAFNLTGRASYGIDVPGSATKNDLAQAVAIDSAGRIVVSGVADAGSGVTMPAYDFAVLRVMPNGVADPNFDADGRAIVAFDLGASRDDQAAGQVLQSDDRIVLVGAVDTSPVPGTLNYDIGVARLLPDGSPDGGFGIGGKTLVPFDLIANGGDAAIGVVQQSNGKLIVVGYSQSSVGDLPGLKGTSVRLNRDGSLDAGYGVLGKSLYDFGITAPSAQLLRGIALRGDQIIAGGGVRLDNAEFTIDDFVVRLVDDLIFADGAD